MKRNVIFFIDDDSAARNANARALSSLLDDKSLDIRSQEPLPNFGDYAKLVAEPTTAAFVLDQRMKGSGRVNYNGSDLAHYLRGIDGKMPIYILTGHKTDDFEESKHLVEYIVGKDDIDAKSGEAKAVKARMLRHLDVFNDVRDAQQQRFHGLLVKSLSTALSEEEQREMDQIEGDTTAAVLAAERNKERALGEQVEKLQRILKP